MSAREPIQQNYSDPQAELLASDGVDDSLEQGRKTGWPEADETVCKIPDFRILLRHCIKVAQVEPESQGSLQDRCQFLSMPFYGLGGGGCDGKAGLVDWPNLSYRREYGRSPHEKYAPIESSVPRIDSVLLPPAQSANG
jgi:hypothetical protein